MILVMDDDASVTEMLEELLVGTLGYRCLITANLEDAYRRVMERGDRIELCLLDLRIGDDARAGLRLAAMIRQIGDPAKAEVPIVLTTGDYDFVQIADLAAEHRLAGLLSKPFRLAELTRVIETCSRPAAPQTPEGGGT